MSTGQYPKRRETDTRAERRVARLELRRRAYMESGRPLNEVDSALAKANRPRISASGRLVSGLS